MNKVFIFILLLITASCNPAKRLTEQQADVNRLADAVINSRVTPAKDSVVFVTGRKDSLITTYRDSNTIYNNHFYHSTDTLKFYFQDNVRLEAALRSFNIDEGKITQYEDRLKEKDKYILYLSIALGVFLFVLAAIIFIKFKI